MISWLLSRKRVDFMYLWCLSADFKKFWWFFTSLGKHKFEFLSMSLVHFIIRLIAIMSTVHMEWILGCQTSQIMVMVLMKIALFMMENGMMFHVTKKHFLFVNRREWYFLTEIVMTGKYIKLYKWLKPLNYTRQKPPSYIDA